MQQNLEEKIRSSFDYFRESLALVSAKYKEKGWQYFKIPIGIGLGSAFFFYSALYKPITAAVNAKEAEIAAMKAQMEVSTTYNANRSQIIAAERQFPAIKDKTEWLGSIISKACLAEGVVPGQTTAPTESMDSDLIIVSVSFDIVADMRKIGSIIARIENSDRFLKVENVVLRKSSTKGNTLSANVRLITVFPKNTTGNVEAKG